MATNSDGEVLPKPLTVIKLLRELAEVLDKHGDLPVVAPNLETVTWADVEDVRVKDGKCRVLIDMMSKEAADPETLLSITEAARILLGAVKKPSTEGLALQHDVLGEANDDAWGHVWLHGNWRYLTSKMSNIPRELAADAVQRWNEQLNRGSGEDTSLDQTELRWWRY